MTSSSSHESKCQCLPRASPTDDGLKDLTMFTFCHATPLTNHNSRRRTPLSGGVKQSNAIHTPRRDRIRGRRPRARVAVSIGFVAPRRAYASRVTPATRHARRATTARTPTARAFVRAIGSGRDARCAVDADDVDDDERAIGRDARCSDAAMGAEGVCGALGGVRARCARRRA